MNSPKFQELATSEAGLPSMAAADRISKIGIILRQFTNPLANILLIAAAGTLALQEFKETGIISAAVVIRDVIGFLQELKAEKSIQAWLPFRRSSRARKPPGLPLTTGPGEVAMGD